MVRSVRDFLTDLAPIAAASQPDSTFAKTPRELRGKYKYVPTSSAAFIERKADELAAFHSQIVVRWPWPDD